MGAAAARWKHDGMKVIDHREGSWYLLQEDEELLLDAHCEHRAFGYSVLIVLNLSERRAYLRRGPDALDELARAIDDSAPVARGSTSRYRDRDRTSMLGHEVTEAVRAWQAATV